MLGGAGHGWIAPFYYSLGLLIAYPATFLRMRNAGDRTSRGDVAMLVVGACATLLLFLDICVVESDYFWQVVEIGMPLVAVWLCLWAGWPILVVVNLVRMSLRQSS